MVNSAVAARARSLSFRRALDGRPPGVVREGRERRPAATAAAQTLATESKRGRGDYCGVVLALAFKSCIRLKPIDVTRLFADGASIDEFDSR